MRSELKNSTSFSNRIKKQQASWSSGLTMQSWRKVDKLQNAEWTQFVDRPLDNWSCYHDLHQLHVSSPWEPSESEDNRVSPSCASVHQSQWICPCWDRSWNIDIRSGFDIVFILFNLCWLLTYWWVGHFSFRRRVAYLLRWLNRLIPEFHDSLQT